jgi:hypothetical protein
VITLIASYSNLNDIRKVSRKKKKKRRGRLPCVLTEDKTSDQTLCKDITLVKDSKKKLQVDISNALVDEELGSSGT